MFKNQRFLEYGFGLNLIYSKLSQNDNILKSWFILIWTNFVLVSIISLHRENIINQNSHV